ncbi:MAG: aspartate 1-decarboxylase [Proteobacteria bacterium]|nr:MAG: aspartate 1-decarboxylase [Pseudomonadota bacterium]
MKLTLMKSKLHRATCTEADLNYEGSISIDPGLIDQAEFYHYERVDIYNINNGNRFSTYVIPGRPGQIGVNGAAARLVSPGDKLIIVTYAEMEPEEARKHRPKVVLLEDNNHVKAVYSDSGHKLD